jgi:hypothetical protein
LLHQYAESTSKKIRGQELNFVLDKGSGRPSSNVEHGDMFERVLPLAILGRYLGLHFLHEGMPQPSRSARLETFHRHCTIVWTDSSQSLNNAEIPEPMANVEINKAIVIFTPSTFFGAYYRIHLRL